MQDSYEYPTGFSIKQVSGILDIPQSTLRDWEKFFSINVSRNDFKQRVYDEKALNTFQEIKQLKAKGLRLKEIKDRIVANSEPYETPTNKIEIISNEPVFNNDFEIILKPYTDRIKQLEIIENKYVSMVEDIATLKERVKNKDEIIALLSSQLAEHKARQWWQIWK